MDDQPVTSQSWGKARFKLFFNARGNVVRVTPVQSSGNKARDLECIAWCKTRTIPIPKKGVRTNAQWLVVDIDPSVVLSERP